MQHAPLEIFYDPMPNTTAGSVQTFKETLPGGIPVVFVCAKWKDREIQETLLDTRFKHYKFHRLMCMAGFAAFTFKIDDISCKAMYGFASRRDLLPYVNFNSVQAQYGPTVIQNITTIVCSGITSTMTLIIDEKIDKVEVFKSEMVRHMNEKMQELCLSKSLTGKASSLHSGVYVTGLCIEKTNTGTQFGIEYTRPEDSKSIFFEGRRFLMMRTRCQKVTSKDLKKKTDEGDDIPLISGMGLHFGSWIYISNKHLTAAQNSKIHIDVKNLNIRHDRNPRLFEMYEKP